MNSKESINLDFNKVINAPINILIIVLLTLKHETQNIKY